MAKVPARSPAVPVPVVAALILALLVFAEVAAEGPTVCDTVKCGKGTCGEVQGIILPWTVPYMCTCDPGWIQPKAFGLTVPFAPCMIPDCPFDHSCFNLSLGLPRGIPILDPCVAINCGPGECKKGDGWSYTCECDPGYVNFLNLTALPCVKSCAFGTDCARLGVAPPPPPPPSRSPPPGSISLRRLLQLLFLVSLAVFQLG